MSVNHIEWSSRDGNTLAAEGAPRLQLPRLDPKAGGREQALEFGQHKRMRREKADGGAAFSAVASHEG